MSTNHSARPVSRGNSLPRLLRSLPRTLSLLLGVSALTRAQATVAMVPSDPVRELGLSVAASGGPRDTLGLLVASVVRNSPADQAGITPGSRILAVNGKPVRLAPNDIGRSKAADSALTKFEEAVRTTPSGSDVMLRVAGGGRTRNVSLPIADRRASAGTSPVSDTARSAVAIQTPASPDTATRVTPVVTTTPAPSPAFPAHVAPAPARGADAVPSAPTLNRLIDALGEAQLDVRRLARDAASLALSDSLIDVEQSIALLRARVRGLQASHAAKTRSDTLSPIALPAEATPPVAAPPAAAVTPAAPAGPAASPPAVLPASANQPPAASAPGATFGGLQLTPVSSDLASYLGPQGTGALLVAAASDLWEPMRVGDVILQLNGGAPDVARLRAAFESREAISLTLLRRGRTFTVSLGGVR